MFNYVINNPHDRRFSCLALAALSAILLSVAFSTQYYGGFEPCFLCRIQRVPHFFVVVLGCTGFFFTTLSDKNRKRLLWLIGLCLFASSGTGFYHSGIEYGIYSGFSSCSNLATETTVETLHKKLLETELVRCNTVTISFLGLSMAVYNGLISLGAAIIATLSTKAQLKGNHDQGK